MALTRRRQRALLGLLAAAGSGVFAATVVLAAQVTPGQRAAYGLNLAPGWDSGLNGLALLLLGLVVLRSLPGQATGRVLAASGFFWLLVGLADAYDGWALLTTPPAAGAGLALWFSGRFGSFLLVGVPLLLLVYPTGRAPAGRWGVVGRVGVVLVAAWATAVTLLPGTLNGEQGPPGVLDYDAATLPVDPAVGSVVGGVLGMGALAGALATVGVVWHRHRVSRGLERRRIRWLLWAATADVGLAVVATVLQADGVLAQAMFSVGVLLPAVAVTIGLVHPEVVGVDELLSTTLVHGLTATAVVLVDLAALATLTAMVGERLDQRAVVLLVLVVAALLYWPLRNALVGRVRRLVLGTRDDPYDVVAGLASRLESAGDVRDQLDAVARAVAGAFGVRHVRVEVDQPGGERLTASYGPVTDGDRGTQRPDRGERVLPITFRDEEVGRIVLPRDGLRMRLSRRDEALLSDLVRQAALAARAARLAAELQESRERLVLAREEERRRIRRDLHDGLGPALSGVVFRIESARVLLPEDTAAADRALEVARDQVRDVVGDVRRLVHDLRPPALDDLGLLGALRQQADVLTAPGFGVHVDADHATVADLPAAVEVAAYRVVGEAVTNAARHAAASRCDVRLVAEPGVLRVEVVDDGVGVDPAATAGVGLVSLRERVAELGGRSEVVCPPSGGTTVRAWLPLRSTA